LRRTIITKPITISKKPTGIVKNVNQINAPVPLLSFHMEPPWKSEVMKARRIGEKAKMKPARMSGNLFIDEV
jgi:hypothetical protein